jgi:hypothetical protein
MDESLLNRLRARRPAIRREWEAFLRAEPVATPLGHPDVLAHLISRTLNVLFASLGAAGSRHRSAQPCSYAAIRAICDCGRNPLLAYFIAGERALQGALSPAWVESGDLPPETRDKAAAELYLVLHDIARREVESFCSLCQQRDAARPAISAASAA